VGREEVRFRLYTFLIKRIDVLHEGIRRMRNSGTGERTAMCNATKGADQDAVGQCSICGGVARLMELPGRMEKCCLSCSADMATSILLTAEIDAATLNGWEAEALVAEFSEVSARMLERAQSR
jgi:hypothetical protein